MTKRFCDVCGEHMSVEGPLPEITASGRRPIEFAIMATKPDDMGADLCWPCLLKTLQAAIAEKRQSLERKSGTIPFPNGVEPDVCVECVE